MGNPWKVWRTYLYLCMTCSLICQISKSDKKVSAAFIDCSLSLRSGLAGAQNVFSRADYIFQTDSKNTTEAGRLINLIFYNKEPRQSPPVTNK